MWYRRAHHLSRNEAVPALEELVPAVPTSRQLRPPSAAGLARTQSSPDHAGREAAASTTPVRLPNANQPTHVASGSSSHTPTHSISAPPPLLAVSSTLKALVRLATGLLQQLQANPREPGAFLIQTYENILRSSQRLLNNTNLDAALAEPLGRLRSLVEEFWRLSTMPLERTPEAWLDLLLPVHMTLGITLPPEPPASWYQHHQVEPQSSTSSSLNDMGTGFGSYMDVGTQQQQSYIHSYDEQRLAASDMTMMGEHAGNLPDAATTFLGPPNGAQAGIASTSQTGGLSDLANDNELRHYNMNASSQPWSPVQLRYPRAGPSTATHNLPHDAYNPPLTAQDDFAFSNAHAYLQPNEAYLSAPTEWENVSQPDSGVYSATQSFSLVSEERESGKGKGPADDSAGASAPVWH